MNLKWTQTPYGFKEAVYRNYVITNGDGTYYPKGILINIAGDEIFCDNVADAKDKINQHILWELQLWLETENLDVEIRREKDWFVVSSDRLISEETELKIANYLARYWESNAVLEQQTDKEYWIIFKGD